MKKLFYYLILSTSLISVTASAQKLPGAMYFSENEHILYTGGAASTGFYDESQIQIIHLWFSQPDYWAQLTANYTAKIDIPALMVVNGDTFPDVGVRFKGNTSYMMIQNSQKKSFNITLDHINPDQNIEGYNTLNLNNAFEDASFMREVAYLHFIRNHIPAAKGSFAQLYINGQNWGIYPNVQQIDRRYANDWFFSNDGTLWRADKPSTTGGGPGGGGPGWGDGTAGLNNLGADTTTYKQYYTLKGTDKAQPWDDLVKVCNILNTTPIADLETEFRKVMDLDRTLWFLASEIAFSDDDSYVHKGKMDYYLYWDEVTGLMVPLEFDGNSVMKSSASTWGAFYNANKVNYPLLNRLLSVPSIRQRYLAHMRTIISDELDPAKFNALIDQYDALISAGVAADTKKIYTLAQYGTEKQTIKTFVQNHRNTLLANTEVNVQTPVLTNIDMKTAAGTWASPIEYELVNVTAQATFASGISGVNLYYSNALTGNFEVTTMSDDGQHNDGAAADGIYGGQIPGFLAASTVRFYVEAIANNAANTRSYMPKGAEHDVYYYHVTAVWADNRPVVINEVMAANTSTIADEAGQYDDWLEIYNLTNQPVDLSGYYLTDNPENIDKWQFPSGTTIAANGYIVVWCDEDGSQGPLHANFKLSASGESLQLLDPNQKLVDTLTYSQLASDKGYARIPNGLGPFVVQNPTYLQNNEQGVPVIDINNLSNTWTLVPNPADEQVTLRITGDPTGQYIIRDVQGKLMFQTLVATANTQIPTQNWPSGIYFVQHNDTYKKLIIKH